MVYNNKPQYNNNYPKKNFSNSTDSNGGTAKITSTKKSGCILEVNLNNQNLVLKGFWDNRVNGWKLFPYYDREKQIQLLINQSNRISKEMILTINYLNLKRNGESRTSILMNTSNS